MSFLVVLEGKKSDISRYLDDVRAELRCTLQWVAVHRSWAVNGRNPDVNVRIVLSGPEAPHQVARAYLQDIVSSAHRLTRREPIMGSAVPLTEAPPITAEELRAALLAIACQDTGSMSLRLVGELEERRLESGGPELTSKDLAKVCKLVVIHARNTEELDAGRGLTQREPANNMWSELANRIEARPPSVDAGVAKRIETRPLVVDAGVEGRS